VRLNKLFMNGNELIKEAIRCRHLLRMDRKVIYQCAQYHQDNWNDPEEPIRAETYAWLTIEKGYSPRQIRVEFPVKIGSKKTSADIVVCSPEDERKVLIVVENKRADVSKAQEKEAIEEARSYAVALEAEYFLYDCGDGGKLFQRTEKGKQHEYVGNRDKLPENIEAEAYLLLEVEPPHSPRLAKQFSRDDTGIVYAAAVWGAFDILMHVQKSSTAALYSTIAKIQTDESVLRTITYPVRMGHATRYEANALEGSAKWAFVFLRVKAQKIGKMFEWLENQTKCPPSGEVQIKHVCRILGKYDIAILLRYNREKQLSEYVMNTIQTVWKENLKETSTIPAVDGMVYVKGETVS